MKKRLFTLLLALCMVFSMLPQTASAAELVASGSCGSGLTWELGDDGVLDIYGDGAIPDYTTHSKAPWYDYRADILGVIFEEGITGIGKEAFAMCTNVEEMIFAGDAPTIASNAFLNITATAYYHAYNETWTEDKMQNYGGTLTWEPFVYVVDSGTCGDDVIWELTEEGVLLISGTGAMEDYNYTSSVLAPWYEYREYLIAAVIDDGVTTIGNSAFTECRELQEIVFSDTVTSIGKNAFEYCYGLTSVTIPDSVTSIGDSAFSFCENLASITIPNSVTSIGAAAFESCYALPGFTIPDKLTKISQSTFSGCNFTNITIPASVTEVGSYAFDCCYCLTEIVFKGDAPTIGAYSFGSVTATAYYPASGDGWTEDVMQNYGGELTWEVYCSNHVSVIRDAVEATCTEDGYTGDEVCQYCGKLISKGSVVPATGHSFGEWTVTTEPTCTEKGIETRTCANCDTTETQEVDATGHSFGEWVVTAAPTCTEKGIETRTCANCDTTETREVDATGHSVSDWTVATEPTCTEKGEETGTCATCGETVTRDVDALGHTMGEDCVDNEDGKTHTGTCTVCGALVEDDLHSFVDGFCEDCGAIALVAPELLSIFSREQTSCKATWAPVDHAEGYELWRTTAPEDEESWRRIKTIKDGAQDRYTNQGLEVGITYYYKVRAYIGEEEATRVYSEFSEVKYMPAAVVFDDPYSNSTFRIRLRWEEIGGADGYQIWRLNDDGTWGIIKTLGDKGNTLTNDQGATVAYSNVGLEAGKQYTYKMRAFSIPEDGVKVYGAYSDAYTVAVKPEAPELTVSSPKAGRATLEWNAVNGAAGYQIWMAESENGEYKIVKSIKDGSTTSYIKNDLQSGKTYYFKIRAYAEVDGKMTFSAFTKITSVTVK